MSAASCVSRFAVAQDSPVGDDDVAGLDGHQISGDDVGRGDGAQRSVANHPGLRDLHLGQRVDARTRLQLLAGPEHDVEQDEQEPTTTRRRTWPMIRLTTATTTSMMFIGSRSWSSATFHMDARRFLLQRVGP